VLGWANISNGDDIYPDGPANAAGATVKAEGGQLKVDVPTWQLSVDLVNFGHASLDWTRVSYWNLDDWWGVGGANRSVFVFGYETPAAAMPASGTATYSGLAEGTAFNALNQGATEVKLSGNASFTADFGARTVTGSLTGMIADAAPWNSVAFSSQIAGNGFSGSTSVTSAPAGAASLGINATGTLEGKFFGPSAQEAGAVWTLFDGAKAAIGTLSGKRP
jgi:hypothetical protein